MNDFNFEELLENFLPSHEKKGEMIKAILLRKDFEYGYLNINSKLEGRIKLNEIVNLEIGDEFNALIIEKDEDFITVSKDAFDRKEAFKSIRKGDIIKGKIEKKLKNTYLVNIGLLKAVLPFKNTNFSKEYIPNNEEFEFEVVDKNSKYITLSRMSIIKNAVEEFYLGKNVGDLVKGRVSNKVEYGYIIEIEEVFALLHNTELNWNKEVKKKLKLNDEIEAKIIEIDKENKKVKLSLKRMRENPWEKIKERYSIGQSFEAKIKEIFDFGVLVDLGDAEGFIHISYLYYKKTNNIRKEYSKGDIIFCEIIEINDEKERISLSARKVFDKFWENIDDIYNINTVITTTISKIKDFGIFVKTEDQLEIFVPKSEFSYKNEKMNFKLGNTLDVKIIEINKEDKNIVASIKKLGTSPWEIANSKYILNEVYELEVTDIIENGFLVKLTDDFKGLVPSKEMIEIPKVRDLVKVLVFSKNKDKNSILLSEKRIQEIQEKKEYEELMKIYGV